MTYQIDLVIPTTKGDNMLYETNQELIEQIKMELGQPFLRIELEPQHYDYIIRKALDEYQIYKQLRKDVTIQIQENQSYFTINDPMQIGLGIVLMPEVYQVLTQYRQMIFEAIRGFTGTKILKISEYTILLNQLQLTRLSVSAQGVKYSFEFNIKDKKVKIIPVSRISGKQYVVYYSKYQNISEVDQMGREWVFKYQLQNQKMILGRIRSKYSGVQTPVGNIETDGVRLMEEQRTEMEQLTQELRRRKDNLAYDLKFIG